MSFKLSAADAEEITENYLTVENGNLINFSWKTLDKFYPRYCKLRVDLNLYEGTKKDKFIDILASQSSEKQLMILEGLLRYIQFEKFSAEEKKLKKNGHDQILKLIKDLQGLKDSLEALKIKELDNIDTAFSSYKAIKILGEGGAGRVYLVENKLKQKFAIKFLNPDKVTTQKLKRFKNEVFFSLEIKHDNIIRALDFGFVKIKGNKYPFYVMPYMEKTFKNLIAETADPGQKLYYLNSILEALEHSHSTNTWHRDLKPENILYNHINGKLVLSDFGIAHIVEDFCRTEIETKEGARMGNFRYASPEQRNEGGSVDQRTDIYSLGLIINEMYTQEVPWGADYKRIIDVEPGFGFLDPLVDRMLKQNPNERISTIKEVKKELKL